MKRATSISDIFVKGVNKKPATLTMEQEQFMEEDVKNKEIITDDFDLNPYHEDKFLIDGYVQLSEVESNTGSLTPEEDCILAEIEYFREKAAYYRMQKNVVALEASKMKKILTQMGLIK